MPLFHYGSGVQKAVLPKLRASGWTWFTGKSLGNNLLSKETGIKPRLLQKVMPYLRILHYYQTMCLFLKNAGEKERRVDTSRPKNCQSVPQSLCHFCFPRALWFPLSPVFGGIGVVSAWVRVCMHVCMCLVLDIQLGLCACWWDSSTKLYSHPYTFKMLLDLVAVH